MSSPEVTAASLEQLRREKLVREHVERFDVLLRTADEAEGRSDWAAANNALQLALGLKPSDELRARADLIARKSLETQAAQLSTDAKAFDRAGQPQNALPLYLKALQGRPDDPELLYRAAAVMVRLNKELPRAAEFARKAVQLAPRSIEAHVALAHVFLAGGLRASAVAAVEAAAKLDPTAPAVKELQAKLKG